MLLLGRGLQVALDFVSYAAYDVLPTMDDDLDTSVVSSSLAALEASMVQNPLTNGLKPGGLQQAGCCG